MGTAGLDAYGALPVNELHAYGFVGRYVAEQPGKCITAAEAHGYRAAGKGLILVYEDNANDGLGGANAGAAKAQIARPILKEIGWPTDRPVHFAFDMPGFAADLPTFVACAKAFAAGIGRPPGVYGDVDTCTAAHNAGIRYLWQFGEGRAPGITVYQSPAITAPWGQSIDPDEALAHDYGQVPYASPTPPTPEIEMLLIVTNPNNGGQAVLNLADGTYFGFPSPDMLTFYEANGVPVAKRQPTKAEWEHFTQKGTI